VTWKASPLSPSQQVRSARNCISRRESYTKMTLPWLPLKESFSMATSTPQTAPDMRRSMYIPHPVPELGALNQEEINEE